MDKDEIKELAIKAKKLTSHLSADDILEKLIANGWYSKHFTGMHVIAINPFYKSFNLSVSGQWIDLGFLNNEFWLWIYPTEEILDIFNGWVVNA